MVCYQGYGGYTHKNYYDPNTGKGIDNTYAFDLIKDSWWNTTGTAGEVVVAAASGTTWTWDGNDNGSSRGWDVYTRLSDGNIVYYAHLTDLTTTINDGWVNKGEVIGKVFNFGTSNVSHLHFQVGRNSQSLPLDFGVWNYPTPGTSQPGGPTYSSGEWKGTAIPSSCNSSPEGFVDAPAPNETVAGTKQIRGWAKVNGDSIRRIEIWIDGVKKDDATYGTPRPDAGGNYGWYYNWDTTQYSNGTHSIQVKAISVNWEYTWLPNANGGSAPTTTSVIVQNQYPPNMPTNLRMSSATGNSITLAWNDNSSNETGFKIYKWGYDGSNWDFLYLDKVSANITTFTDTGLTCGRDYFYQISAYNSAGESNYTNWIKTPTAGCPDLVYSSQRVDDDDSGQSHGNNNGIAECGEDIELYVDLYNQGGSTATGVNTTISTTDPYLTWLYNTDSNYPDVPVSGTGTNYSDFDFSLDPDTPDGHWIQFDLTTGASNGGPWYDSFSVRVTCPPDLTYNGLSIDDNNSGQSRGNNNRIVECGEKIELYVDLYNQGGSTATGVNTTISTTDPYLTWLYNTDSNYPDVPASGTRTNYNDFDFSLDSDTPDGHWIQFDLNTTATGGSWTDYFLIPVICSEKVYLPIVISHKQ